MKKQIAIAAAVAALAASCCNEKSLKTDFDKPLYTIDIKGDTICKWLYDENDVLIADLAGPDTVFYKYNDKNQILEERHDTQIIAYEYDERGNQISVDNCGDLETMTYNDKNQITSYTFSSNGKDIVTAKYEYDGQKQTETMTVRDFVYGDNGGSSESSPEIEEDTKISIRYCIDPECKYDTLELSDCGTNPDQARHVTRKKWEMAGGKYQETFHSQQSLENGKYSHVFTFTNEYNENGQCVKYTYYTSDSPTPAVTTYAIEGNKVTDSNGNVSVFMEK